MTCANDGKPPWANKEHPTDPVSCGDPDDGDGGGDGGCGEFDLDGKGNCPDWVAGPGVCPVAPINPQVVHAYLKGVLDLRWDNPALLTKNTPFDVVGVNLYLSLIHI